MHHSFPSLAQPLQPANSMPTPPKTQLVQTLSYSDLSEPAYTNKNEEFFHEVVDHLTFPEELVLTLYKCTIANNFTIEEIMNSYPSGDFEYDSNVRSMISYKNIKINSDEVYISHDENGFLDENIAPRNDGNDYDVTDATKGESLPSLDAFSDFEYFIVKNNLLVNALILNRNFLPSSLLDYPNCYKELMITSTISPKSLPQSCFPKLTRLWCDLNSFNFLRENNLPKLKHIDVVFDAHYVSLMKELKEIFISLETLTIKIYRSKGLLNKQERDVLVELKRSHELKVSVIYIQEIDSSPDRMQIDPENIIGEELVLLTDQVDLYVLHPNPTSINYNVFQNLKVLNMNIKPKTVLPQFNSTTINQLEIAYKSEDSEKFNYPYSFAGLPNLKRLLLVDFTLTLQDSELFPRSIEGIHFKSVELRRTFTLPSNLEYLLFVGINKEDYFIPNLGSLTKLNLILLEAKKLSYMMSILEHLPHNLKNLGIAVDSDKTQIQQDATILSRNKVDLTSLSNLEDIFLMLPGLELDLSFLPFTVKHADMTLNDVQLEIYFNTFTPLQSPGRIQILQTPVDENGNSEKVLELSYVNFNRIKSLKINSNCRVRLVDVSDNINGLQFSSDSNYVRQFEVPLITDNIKRMRLPDRAGLELKTLWEY